MNVAVFPAIGFTAMTVFLFISAVHSRGRSPLHTHRVAISVVFLFLGINSLVAALALLGFVKDQNTITFWAAVSRTAAALIGSYIAYRWWVGD